MNIKGLSKDVISPCPRWASCALALSVTFLIATLGCLIFAFAYQVWKATEIKLNFCGNEIYIVERAEETVKDVEGIVQNAEETVKNLQKLLARKNSILAMQYNTESARKANYNKEFLELSSLLDGKKLELANEKSALSEASSQLQEIKNQLQNAKICSCERKNKKNGRKPIDKA